VSSTLGVLVADAEEEEEEEEDVVVQF